MKRVARGNPMTNNRQPVAGEGQAVNWTDDEIINEFELDPLDIYDDTTELQRHIEECEVPAALGDQLVRTLREMLSAEAERQRVPYPAQGVKIR
jgi:hypothetical protein